MGDMRPVFRLEALSPHESSVYGRTIYTKTIETSDDEPGPAKPPPSRGYRRPFLAGLAVDADGWMRGRTRITAVPETSDDDA